ncbi:MAG TPA: hypothetical protein VFZ84_11940 [Burkholderiales bacterium]
MTQLELDRLYDELAALVDRTPPAERERVLARLVIALAQEVGDYVRIKAAIAQL